MTPPPIIPLEPQRVWRTYRGGRELDRLLGIEPATDGPFPEDWLASTTPAANPVARPEGEGLTRARLDGRSTPLRDLLRRFPDALLGADHVGRFGPELGFLAKLLDSSIRLHIQAHPTAAYARQHLGKPHGKAEGYVILATRPEVAEPYIYLGFQRPPEPEAYRRAILEQDETALLAPFDKVLVKPGDAFVVPGGLPHAIGEGVLMLEVMEPSDLVVRLEFERGGYVLPESARFMGHSVDLAIDLMDFAPLTADALAERCFASPRLLIDDGSTGRLESLIDARQTPCFVVQRWRTQAAASLAFDTFAAALITRGSGHLTAGDCRQPFRVGDRFLIAHHTDRLTLASQQPCEVLLVFPPGG